MDVATGKEERLTHSRGDDLWPVPSPDGARIAFVSTRDGNKELYVMRSDGAGQTRLTITKADEEDPDWSPDGKRIAFTSMRDGNEEIYVIDVRCQMLDDSGACIPNPVSSLSSNIQHPVPIRLTDGPVMDAIPVWSPDGKKILFVSMRDGNPELYLLSIGSQSSPASIIQHPVPIRLTDHPANDGLDSHLWSPDGKQIVFVSERDLNLEIYGMASNGSGVHNVTSNPATDDGPVGSPDGRSIVFVSDRSGGQEIYRMAMDGSEVMQLTTTGGDHFWPVWSPDGKQIAFTSTRDGNPEIYVMDGDGSHQRRMTHTDAEEKWVSWIK